MTNRQPFSPPGGPAPREASLSADAWTGRTGDERANTILERERYRLLKQAVEALARVCDGAIMRDDVGYNGTDTKYGQLLAFLPLEAWPPAAFHRAWRMLRKYHQQLARAGIDYFAIPEPPNFEGQDRQIALHPMIDGFLVVFPYDAETIHAFRHLPGEEFLRQPVPHRIVHAVPGAGAPLLAFAELYGFQLAPGVRERVAALGEAEARTTPSAYRVTFDPKERDAFALYFPRDQVLNAEVKALPGHTYSYEGGFHWVIWPRQDAAAALLTFLENHSQFSVSPEIERRLREIASSSASPGHTPRW